MKSRTWRVLRNGAIVAALVCIAVLGLSALVNRRLPSHSKLADRLSPLDKARLAEVFHLRQILGETVWPGWGQKDIPIIVYNEEYAFLIGYSNPPPGWIKMPQRTTRGGPWQQVPDDSFENQPYYRQRLPDSNKTHDVTVLLRQFTHDPACKRETLSAIPRRSAQILPVRVRHTRCESIAGLEIEM